MAIDMNELETLKKSSFFDPQFYLDRHRDVAVARLDPYAHYLENGWRERRLPAPLFNWELLKTLTSYKPEMDGNPVLFLENCRAKCPGSIFRFEYIFRKNYEDFYIVKNSRYFDGGYYLEHYPDVKDSGLDPVSHYLKFGFKEDREPSGKYRAISWVVKHPFFNRDTISPIVFYEKYGASLKVSDEEKAILNDLNQNWPQFILPGSAIRKMVGNPEIKIVSFDIFNTLMTRNSNKPEDIFKLMAEKLRPLGLDTYCAYREKAEKELANPNASLDDIYKHLYCSHMDINPEVLNLLKNVEISTEYEMNARRQTGWELYQAAHEAGKRIICVSDMYLSSDHLKKMLQNCGYGHIDKIYVSNECGSRKDSGQIYDFVISGIGAMPGEILHIGDNIYSDYFQAQRHGWKSAWLPDAKYRFLSFSNLSRDNWKDSQDLSTRFFEGFTRERIRDDDLDLPADVVGSHDHYFKNFSQFARLTIIPIVTGIALQILKNAHIQKNYKKILFASRDGYLPKLAYDMLRDAFGGLPSEYVYASRKAYGCLFHESVYDYIASFPKGAKLADILSQILPHNPLAQEILGDAILRAPMPESRHNLLKMLAPWAEKLEIFFAQLKSDAIAYYKKFASPTSREIIFDCGYSGSISRALSKAMGKPVDKIYLYETDENKTEDARNGTMTFCIFEGSNIPPNGLNLLYEELFSPIAPSCAGFIGGEPVFDKEEFSASMREKYELLEKETIEYVNHFISDFQKSFKLLAAPHVEDLQKILTTAIFSFNNSTLELLDDIIFKDATEIYPDMTLAEKLSFHLPYDSSFAGTYYLRETALNRKLPQRQELKLGIHLHLFYTHTIQQFVQQLAFFPADFDLHITIPENIDESFVKFYFEKEIIPHLGEIQVIKYPNRGRDIAPWILGMRGIQDEYDLFCHIQSKASIYSPVGGHWRSHLLNNLIGQKYFANIYNLFAENGDLGVLIPKSYSHLVCHIADNKIDLMGMFGEFEMIQDLLARMGIKKHYTRKDHFYSIGTMFWYRPYALRQLFEFPLYIEEFEQEPIGVGGTLAHAFERLPPFIAACNGYKNVMYPDAQEKMSYYRVK